MFYSAKTGGMYPLENFSREDMPEGVVEITDQMATALLSSGQDIVPDADGYPTLAEPTLPTPKQQLASDSALRDSLLALATLRINPLQDAVDDDDASDEEMALLKNGRLTVRKLGA